FLSTEWLAGWRPFSVPLLYRILPNSDSARTAGQLAVSVVCWLVLAAVVALCLRRSSFAAFCLVLLFSLSVWITQWDSVVLSESMAISLCALMLAAWLALIRAPNGWTIAAVLVTAFLWTFTRDTDAFVVLLSVPFVVVWALRGARRRSAILLALGLVAISTGGLVSAGVSSGSWGRWEQPLLHVIG